MKKLKKIKYKDNILISLINVDYFTPKVKKGDKFIIIEKSSKYLWCMQSIVTKQRYAFNPIEIGEKYIHEKDYIIEKLDYLIKNI